MLCLITKMNFYTLLNTQIYSDQSYPNMSFITSFALNDVLSKNNETNYKKAMKGDYDYDYDSDAETVVYDFEEDVDRDAYACSYNSILEKSKFMRVFKQPEEDSEVSEYDSDDSDDEDSINIIIDEYSWPKIDKADDSLSDYEVLQRGYKIIADKSEMFKRMYKTKKCSKKTCEYAKCPFYHSEIDKRQGICAFERGCINKNCDLKH